MAIDKKKPDVRALLIRVDNITHRLLRIRVAEEDMSIQKWAAALIKRELDVDAGGDAGGG